MTRTQAPQPPAPSPVPSPELSATEGAALWRQRLFEAEAGMTRYVAARAESSAIRDWMYTRSELFADLPDPQASGPASWQTIFFRGQALMEKFIVSRFGHEALAEWAARNAEVYRLVEPDRGGGARDPIVRIGRQAELYGSRFQIDSPGPDEATIEIEHCAIWDYRERARARGVQLTLRSPCEYCTKATTANIEAQGYEASYELTDEPSGPGCRWRATRPGATGERGVACAV